MGDLLEEFLDEGELVILFEFKSIDYEINCLTPDKTCNDLLNEVRKALNGVNTSGNPNKAFDYLVEYNSKGLLGNATLESCGLTGGAKFVTVFVSSAAGTQSSTSVSIDTDTRTIMFKDHKQIPKVRGRCCIYNDKDEICAKMTECGCLVSPSAMRGIIQFILNKKGFTRIYCPICFRSKKKYIYWPYQKCLYIACLEGTTKRIIAKVFNTRYETNVFGYKKCPNCKVNNKKKNGVKEYRIRCSSCKKDFCFRCTKSWNASGMIVCGNTSCPTYKKQQEIYNCPVLKDEDNRGWISTRSDCQVPSKRACPSCLNLMKHARNCPHMKCTACGTDFCWICLTPKYYGPGHSWTKCSFAGPQKLG
jgi:hypothetical protein